ncbi:hypothetical protein ACWD60_39725, partial [Streptomyces sp. NPDC005167]
MSDLVSTVIEAHGGLSRYNQFSSATVHLRVGGSLWRLKGQEGVLSHAAVRLDLHRQHASHYPFTTPHRPPPGGRDGSAGRSGSSPRCC